MNSRDPFIGGTFIQSLIGGLIVISLFGAIVSLVYESESSKREPLETSSDGLPEHMDSFRYKDRICIRWKTRNAMECWKVDEE